MNLIQGAMSKADLKIDWATYKAAKFACQNWHYSKCMPKFKQVWIGAWEKGEFKGIISFGRSSTPYLGTSYGLDTTECAELTRIAMRNHDCQISRMMAIAIKLLKKQSIGMRLIVSLADSKQNHHGGIYQATNWIYIGKSSPCTQYFYRGKWRNDSPLMRDMKRNPSLKYLLPKRKIDGKHKYLMPLDKEMRQQILPLSKPYPKRVRSDTSDTLGIPAEKGRCNSDPDAPNSKEGSQ